jgi:hypothetical protein
MAIVAEYAIPFDRHSGAVRGFPRTEPGIGFPAE